MLTPSHIRDLRFSVRTHNALIAADIDSIDKLCSCTRNELLRVPNFGMKSLKEVEDMLAFYNMSLASNTLEGKVHLLKCAEPYSTDIAEGRKTFELRRNDREGGYQIGDILHLYSLSTDRHIHVRVMYVLPGGQFGLDKEFIAMSIRREK